MDFLILLARILFSALFLSSAIGHMTSTAQMAEYAKSKNVPAPKAAVFGSGILLLLGSLSILLGYQVQIGAWLLIVFPLPTAFIMHNFWSVEDPMARQNEQIHFMKDLSLAGAAFLIWYLYVAVEQVPLSLG